MIPAQFPILSLLIFTPILGAISVFALRSRPYHKHVALLFAVLELLSTLLLLINFAADNGDFQWIEQHPWIPSLNIEYLLGVDGITILLLPATALVTVTAMLSAWNAIQHLTAFHFALMLILEAMTVGVFTALDTVLFFLFWELTLPPIFFLIGLWGVGPHRRMAAIKYTLFMLFGGAALLAAICLIAMNVGNVEGNNVGLVFSLPVILQNPIPDELQSTVFILLMLAFAVKAPLLPFHTWMPSVALESPPSVAALLLGLKLGIYGIIRFAMPLAPSAAVEYSWIVGIFGAITVIYGALIALCQTNMRRLLAYAGISHAGLVVVGVTTLNVQGIQGALFQLLNFSFTASTLMLIAGCLQQRLGSTECIHLGGLAKTLPRLTTLYFICVVSSLGVPGTSGFPAELLLIISALDAHPSLGIAALVALVLSAAYFFEFTRKAFYGPIERQGIQKVHDLLPRELVMLGLPVLLILVLGLWPNAVLHTQQKTAEAWLSGILEQPSMKIDEVAGIDQ